MRLSRDVRHQMNLAGKIVARRRMIIVAAAIAAGLAIAPSAAAQQTTRFGDLSGSEHDTSAQDTRVEQVAPVTSSPDDAALMPTQVASADALTEPVTQLSDTGGDGAPPPLSSPAQGKPEGVVHLHGKDRCDPNSPHARDPVCANAIETRAAEFTRPDPTRLTPEQRLLIAQRAEEITAGADAAVRKIGRNDVDPDDVTAQSLASIVLPAPGRPEPPPDDSKSDDIPTDTPAIDILQAVIQLQQSQ